MARTIVRNPVRSPRKRLATKAARKSAPCVSKSYQRPGSATPSSSDDEEDIAYLAAQPPKKEPPSVDTSLRIAMDSVSAVDLRRAMTELGKQMPDAAKALITLLTTSPTSRSSQKRNSPDTLEPALKKTKTVENKVVKERTMKICENCWGEESVEDDGCCKWRMMQHYRCQEARDFLSTFGAETGSDSDPRRICEHCGEEASYEDDGCCKFNMMDHYKREEVRDILRYETDTEDGDESE